MADLSHQTARAYLQTAADDMLSANNQSLLDAHLKGCKECRAYSKSLKSLESRLQRVSHSHWDKYEPRLGLDAVTNPPTAKNVWNNLLGLTQGMGKVTIVAALVLGYFLIVNLGGGQTSSSGTEIPTILPTPNDFTAGADISPTPSAQLALTGLTTLPCNPIIHTVKTTDKLDSIATHYRISKETIMDFNNLTIDEVSPGTRLNIPICDSTPSHTASTPTDTVTVTPLGSLFFPTQPD